MEAEPQLNAAFMPQLALAFAHTPVNLAARQCGVVGNGSPAGGSRA
jgi:hypothetical protein